MEAPAHPANTADTPPDVPLSAAPVDRLRSAAVLSPGDVLRVEGVLILAVAVVLYAQSGASWWLFAGLFLVPDVGMLGYLTGPRIGAATYNLTHTLVAPLLVGAIGLVAGSQLALAIALIWIAHIGFDRALGYGLKYPTRFGDTHLQRVA